MNDPVTYGISVEDYINENTRDGKEGLNIYGNPKQGKSNTANRICKDEMLINDRNMIMPGDVNCEFRNMLFHKDQPIKEFSILVPHDCEFEFLNVPYDVEKHIIKVDYDNDIILEDHFKGKKRKLVVVFDDHLDDLIFYKRLKIWNDIGKQLIRRTTFDLGVPFIFRFDEGGIYFPEIALAHHYQEVYRFNYLNVSYRKSHVQVMLIAQQNTEMKSTIRGKQGWMILKKGAYSKNIPKIVRKATPFFSKDQVALFYGGIYNKEISIYKMKEANKIWKMVPTTDYQERELSSNDEKEREKYVYDYLRNMIPQFYNEYKNLKGLTQTKLAKLTGIPRTTIRDWINNYEQSDEFKKLMATAEV